MYKIVQHDTIDLNMVLLIAANYKAFVTVQANIYIFSFSYQSFKSNVFRFGFFFPPLFCLEGDGCLA